METKYFNFPVCLLSDFMLDPNKVLNNVCDYAVFCHSETLEHGTQLERFKAATSFFNLKMGNIHNSLRNGKELFESIDSKTPKVGLNLSIFWDFYKNEKTEFEKIALLGFLAIKSIVQNKSYCKIDNKFWLARMAGKSKSCEFSELPTWLRVYANEYQTKKIKTELRNNWGLVTYSRYTRGFYVSFKLSLQDLVFEAEKRRKSIKDKQHKQAESEAVQNALIRLHQKTN